jgi:hypothetical protein
MENHPEDQKDLSEQLGTWWRTQTDFTTKKALAEFIKIHPDTLGDYFSGKRSPKSETAKRLYELTSIECLRQDLAGNSSSKIVSKEPSSTPTVPGRSNVDEPIAKPHATNNVGGHSNVSKTEGLQLKGTERAIDEPISDKRKRELEDSVVISFQRNKCPFCGHDLTQFFNCANCGQHFVWANIPVEYDMNNHP